MKRMMIRTLILLVPFCFGILGNRSAHAEKGVYLSVGSEENISKISMVRHLDDSGEIACASGDKCVRVWNLNQWGLEAEYRFQIGSGSVGSITALGSSADEQLIAVGRYGREGVVNSDIIVFQKTPRRILYTLQGHKSSVRTANFFADDKRLLTSEESGKMIVWDVAAGRRIKDINLSSDKYGRITAVAVNRKGQIAIGTSKGGLVLIDGVAIESMDLQRSAHAREVRGLRWREKTGDLVSVGWDGALIAWKVDASKKLRQIKKKDLGKTFKIISLCERPDGEGLVLFSGGDDNLEDLKSTEVKGIYLDGNLGQIKKLTDAYDHRVYKSFFHEGDLITMTGDSKFERRRFPSGELVNDFPCRASDFIRTCFDQQATDSKKSLKVLWEVQRPELIGTPMNKIEVPHGFDLLQKAVFKNPNSVQKEKFAVQGARLGFDPTQKSKGWLAPGNNQQPTPFVIDAKRHGLTIRNLALVDRSKGILGTDFGMFVYDFANNREIRPLSGTSGGSSSVSFSPDRKYMASYSTTNRVISIHFVDKDHVTNPKLFARIMVIGDDWAMVAPDGHFACSPAAEKYIGWHVNEGPGKFANFHELDAFRDRLYEPGYFDALWKFRSPEVALELANIQWNGGVREALGPKVSFIKPASNPRKPVRGDNKFPVTVSVEPNGAELPASVSLLVNNRPTEDYFHQLASGELEHIFNVKLGHGPNEFKAQVTSQTGKSSRSSQALRITYLLDNADQGKQGKLYFIGVGVDEYEDTTNYQSLSYCQSDVQEIGNVFAQRTRENFSEATDVITPSIEKPDQFKQIVNTLLKDDAGNYKTGPTDTLVVMWSGHGDMDADGNLVLVLPSCEKPSRTDDSGLVDNGMPVSVLMRELRKVPNANILLILDTCYSGKAVEQFANSRDDVARKGNDNDYGFMIIAASEADQEAKENESVGMSNLAFLLKTGLLGEQRYSVGEYNYTPKGTGSLVEIDGRKIVTTHSLVSFLKAEMPNLNERQKVIANGEESKHEFLTSR